MIGTLPAIGTKRTSLVALHMSAFGARADIDFCGAHVCFLTQSGHQQSASRQWRARIIMEFECSMFPKLN